MGLACRLRGHKADPASARWNASICFGRCVRCGRDMVCGSGGRWQVPHGYRVVWRPTLSEAVDAVAPPEAGPAPGCRETEALAGLAVAEAPAAATAPEVTEWPLPKPVVYRQEQETAVVPAMTPLPASGRSEPSPVSAGFDFMDDQPEETAWYDFGDRPQRSALG